jgi:hypothetical protein
MALQPTGLMSQTSGARPIRSQVLQDMRNTLLGNIAEPDLSAQLEALSDGQRQHVLQMAKLIRSGGNGNKSWRDAIRSMYPRMQDSQAQIIAALLEDIDPVDPASIQLELDLPAPQTEWAMMKPVEELLGIKPYTYTKPPKDLPLSEAQPIATTLPNTDPFVDRLKQSESSGKLSAEYQTKDGQTYSGLYQFGASRLADYKAASGERFTQDEFKQDAALQEKIMAWHLSDIDHAIAGLGDKVQGYNKDGLRAVAHLGGKSGMAKYVKSGGTYDPSDELGTSLSDYYAKFSVKTDQQT